jgi:hypothetical protein
MLGVMLAGKVGANIGDTVLRTYIIGRSSNHYSFSGMVRL